MHTHVAEIEPTIPPACKEHNNSRISGASVMLGHVHASLVEFDTICVNETLLKRFNCSRNIYREWQLRSIVKVVFWQPEQINNIN